MPLVLSRDALFSRFLCRLAVPQVTEEEREKMLSMAQEVADWLAEKEVRRYWDGIERAVAS